MDAKEPLMANDQTTRRDGTDDHDWRCPCCDKLLGRRRGMRLHLRHGRNHEYIVSLPVSATCRGCGTLSETT